MAHCPYQEFERHPAWQVLDRGIDALVENGDIHETTARRYIIGYLCKLLIESGLVPPVGAEASKEKSDI